MRDFGSSRGAPAAVLDLDETHAAARRAPARAAAALRRSGCRASSLRAAPGCRSSAAPPADSARPSAPLTGSGMSPKCTAAVCASDSTNATKLMPSDSPRDRRASACRSFGHASSRISTQIRMVAYAAGDAMAETAGHQFDRLVEIMRALRAPGGCPWDREQTLASLRPFVLEETYEVLEAIESGVAGGAARRAGRLPLRSGVPGADQRGGRRLLHRRRDRRHLRQARPPPSARVRAAAGRRARSRRGQVIERWETMKARERAAAGGERDARRRRR